MIALEELARRAAAVRAASDGLIEVRALHSASAAIELVVLDAFGVVLMMKGDDKVYWAWLGGSVFGQADPEFVDGFAWGEATPAMLVKDIIDGARVLLPEAFVDRVVASRNS